MSYSECGDGSGGMGPKYIMSNSTIYDYALMVSNFTTFLPQQKSCPAVIVPAATAARLGRARGYTSRKGSCSVLKGVASMAIQHGRDTVLCVTKITSPRPINARLSSILLLSFASEIFLIICPCICYFV